MEIGAALALPVFLAILFAIAVAAGFLGSLTGIGGGVVVIPVLVLFFGVPYVDAIGAGLITILANSITTGATYVNDHLTDLRIGMLLEIATVPGAIFGALLAILLTRSDLTPALLVALAAMLLVGSLGTLWRRRERIPSGVVPDALSRRLRLSGEYHNARTGEVVRYQAERTPRALGVMFLAGITSGLFGIGSGVLKVFALDGALRLPFKVATATSSFMIGVTACAGAGVLLSAGYVDPVLAAPVGGGAALGAYVGTQIFPTTRAIALRWLFALVVFAFAIELVLQAVGVL